MVVSGNHAATRAALTRLSTCGHAVVAGANDLAPGCTGTGAVQPQCSTVQYTVFVCNSVRQAGRLAWGWLTGRRITTPLLSFTDAPAGAAC